MTNFVYPYRYAPMATRHLVGKVMLSLPINRGEGRSIRPWLHAVLGDRAQLSFNYETKCWEVARAHLGAARDAIVERYGLCDVSTENVVSQTHQCDDRCQDAEGPDCTCSCGGEFHGEANTSHSWVRVGDTTLVSRTRTSMTTCRRYIRADLVDLWGSSASKMTDN